MHAILEQFNLHDHVCNDAKLEEWMKSKLKAQLK